MALVVAEHILMFNSSVNKLQSVTPRKGKVAFQDRCPLKRGSIHVEFSLTGQKKGDLLI
jgi:hypothetical protein